MEGRNNAIPNEPDAAKKNKMKTMMTWGEQMERKTCLPPNLSEGLIDGRSRSRRAITRLTIATLSEILHRIRGYTHSFC